MEHKEKDFETLKFEHPLTFVISGPTSSGKSYFVKQCLIHKMLSPIPKQIFWFYGEYQKLFDELLNEKVSIPNIEFCKGIPSEGFGKYTETNEPTLIVIDDLMRDAMKSETISDLFTKGSHHRNLSVMLLTQNLFVQGKHQRDITVNAGVFVMFANIRDKQQIRTFAAQYAPGKSKEFLDVFNDATARTHGYLVVVTKAGTPQDLQLRTNIFPNEKGMIVYVPQKV